MGNFEGASSIAAKPAHARDRCCGAIQPMNDSSVAMCYLKLLAHVLKLHCYRVDGQPPAFDGLCRNRNPPKKTLRTKHDVKIYSKMVY